MSIPDWLNELILQQCPYCGKPIANNESLTDRYCSNAYCPEHVAQKVEVLAKRFDVKNVGIASARELVRIHKITFHTQALLHWFDKKPSLYLYEVGEICLIKGHQKKWREYCEDCDTIAQVLSRPELPTDIKRHGALLVYTEWLCEVKPRLLGKRLNVMLSGSFADYRVRKDFVKDMNQKYGDIIDVVDVGKRETGVAFLVKEDWATDHEKSEIAARRGIQVISPKRLEEKIAAYSTYIRGGGIV